MSVLRTVSAVSILSMFVSKLPGETLLRDAGPFSEMVMFGDCLLDVGNVYAMSGGMEPLSPPYFEGRYSNGPVWVEHMASILGLAEPAASRNGGHDYAHGYAETGPGISTVMGVPNVGMQINDYLSDAGGFDASQLIVLNGGGGDLVYGGKTDPVLMAGNLLEHVDTIVAHGGQNFVMPTMPFNEQMAPILVPFNDLVTAGLAERMATDRIAVYRPDLMQLIGTALANPASFGLSTSIDLLSETALNIETGEIVPNPEEYALWDPLHFTTEFHGFLGEWIGNAGPVLQPGDADLDLDFDQFDLIQVLQAAKYLTGQPATWGEGDWNEDGKFDQLDIVAARATGNYVADSYDAMSGASVAAVPEPHAVLLACLGLLALATCGRLWR